MTIFLLTWWFILGVLAHLIYIMSKAKEYDKTSKDEEYQEIFQYIITIPMLIVFTIFGLISLLLVMKEVKDKYFCLWYKIN